MNQFTFAFDTRSTHDEFTMAVGEHPQQRLENFGVHAVSDTELLAILIQGNGTRPEQAVKMASRLVAEAGSIAGLAAWRATDYRRIKGIGQIKGLQLAAIVEIARRMMAGPRDCAPLLDRPDRIAAHFAPIVSSLEIEKFWVLILNRRNRLIKQIEVTSGTATAALAHPREVFRAVLSQSGAGSVTGIAAVHNHPGGSSEPSSQDVHITRILRDASKTIDIPLIDHVIVARGVTDQSQKAYFSFREAGML